MPAFQNLDLFSVGLAVAGSLVLGFVVFFNNWKSTTNRTFLAFSIVNALWGTVNYLAYQVNTPLLSLWLFRATIFFGLFQAFFLFQFCYLFPIERKRFPKLYTFLLVPLLMLTATITLTPLTFTGIREISSATGQILKIVNGPGIALFGLVSVGLVISAFAVLFRKTFRAHGDERRPLVFVLSGALLMFALIIAFNFIFPAFRNNPRYIPLGAVFTLPFIIGASYAVFKHHLLHVRVVATEVLTFVLSVATLYEVVIEQNPVLVVLRSGVFLLVLAVGILLIKSVLKEIEQREKLEQLTKELENLSRFKTQLLSLASHQIKAPLAAIKGFAELILEGLKGPVTEQIKETVGKMKHSTDELIELINDLLSFRQVEEGKLEYNFEKVEMRDLVKNVTDKLKVLADEKHLEFTVALPHEPIYVNADKQKLAQVVQNLTENAIKYTSHGYVRVTVEFPIPNSQFPTRENEVILRVEDSGLGIPKDLLPHLFDEFIRDERVKKEVRGTGLGLYIARKIVEAHSGTITADSAGEGKGSTFSVRLKKF